MKRRDTNAGNRTGLTLIEMSVVVAIIGILYLTVMPMYASTIQRAKETALRENLQVMRKVLDQYYKDHSSWPENLESLVQAGYLRAVPVDPITQRPDTWVTFPSELGETNVFDVQSGASGKALDGSLYSEW